MKSEGHLKGVYVLGGWGKVKCGFGCVDEILFYGCLVARLSSFSWDTRYYLWRVAYI